MSRTSGTSRWVRQWDIPSRSDPTKTYRVSVDAAGNYACSCPRWKFRREECAHIREARANPDATASVSIDDCVPANVREVQVERDADGRVVKVRVPLIPLGNTHFLATVVHDLFRAGVSWGALCERYRLPREWTPDAVASYIRAHGRLIYGHWQQGRGHVGYVVVWEGESAGERLQ